MRKLITAVALLVTAGFTATAFAQAMPVSAAGDPAKDHRAMHGARHAERFKALDTDGDGVISKAEFLAGAEKMFARLDRDASGTLAADEMHRRAHRHHQHHRQGHPAAPATEGQPKQQ